MITATAHDLIRTASKLAGVLAIGQTMQAEDAQDAMVLLNSLIETWNQNRWVVPRLTDVSCRSTGAQSYSVGPTGDIVCVRPERLQFAYVRQLATTMAASGPVDFPVTVMESYEDYAAISIKKLRSFPSVAFYDATFPLGTLFIWPIPSNLFEIHILIRDSLEQFTDLTTPFAMAPAYYEALLYNLAGRLVVMYQLPMNPGLVALAHGALNTVRVMNHRVANLVMPSGLARHGGWATHGVGGIVEGTFTLDESVLGP